MSDNSGVAPEHVGAATNSGPASLAAAPGCAPRRLGRDELLELATATVDWIWETDAEMRFCWFSQDYQAVTGIDPQSVIGQSRVDLIRRTAGRSQAIDDHLADLEARRPFKDFLYELNAGAEPCHWVSISGYPR